jgi:hypothetical protein
MHVRGYVWTRCAHRHRHVCVPRQMPRLSMDARVSLAIRSAKYIMCMDIRLYLDACTSERHRGARVGVRMRVLMHARVRARWVTSASGYNRRSERIGVSITRMRVRV